MKNKLKVAKKLLKFLPHQEMNEEFFEHYTYRNFRIIRTSVKREWFTNCYELPAEYKVFPTAEECLADILEHE